MVYGWRQGAKWGFFAPLYSLAGPQNRTYFDLSDSFSETVRKVMRSRVRVWIGWYRSTRRALEPSVGLRCRHLRHNTGGLHQGGGRGRLPSKYHQRTSKRRKAQSAPSIHQRCGIGTLGSTSGTYCSGELKSVLLGLHRLHDPHS